MNKKIIAMIPARLGSHRLKYKNLSLIGKYPLIYYAINAAIKSKIFHKIVLNSDNILFEKISNRYGVEFYLRPKKLGNSYTKSDDLVYDFMRIYENYDITVWVNPISPLMNHQNIQDTLNFFIKKRLDSLITTNQKKVHASIGLKPINFNRYTKFSLTQSLKGIELFNYSLMMWKTKKFFNSYKNNKYAFFCGKFSTFELPDYCSIIIKNKYDLLLANKYISSLNNIEKYKVSYDRILNEKKSIY